MEPAREGSNHYSNLASWKEFFSGEGLNNGNQSRHSLLSLYSPFPVIFEQQIAMASCCWDAIRAKLNNVDVDDLVLDFAAMSLSMFRTGYLILR